MRSYRAIEKAATQTPGSAILFQSGMLRSSDVTWVGAKSFRVLHAKHQLSLFWRDSPGISIGGIVAIAVPEEVLKSKKKV